MKRMLIGRIAALIPTVLLASFIAFVLVQLAPGDASTILAGENATAERIEEIRRRLGFDRSLIEQYWTWLSHAARGDLGASVISQESIAAAIGRTLPITLHLVVGALMVAVTLGVIAGVASARRADTAIDAVIASFSSAGAAMPSFWLGLVLVSIFALRLDWLPATGFVSLAADPASALRHLVLPSIALGAVGAAEIARQLRGVLIEILASDHVRTLRAKGLAERRVVWVHALRGAAVPLLTIIGLQVSRLLGATVVVEAVFGIQGVGTLVVDAANNRDYYVVQGVVVVMAAIVILINFAVDVCYRISDPRIR
mgnify:CR=1 FL=1